MNNRSFQHGAAKGTVLQDMVYYISDHMPLSLMDGKRRKVGVELFKTPQFYLKRVHSGKHLRMNQKIKEFVHMVFVLFLYCFSCSSHLESFWLLELFQESYEDILFEVQQVTRVTPENCSWKPALEAANHLSSLRRSLEVPWIEWSKVGMLSTKMCNLEAKHQVAPKRSQKGQ